MRLQKKTVLVTSDGQEWDPEEESAAQAHEIHCSARVELGIALEPAVKSVGNDNFINAILAESRLVAEILKTYHLRCSQTGMKKPRSKKINPKVERTVVS